AYRTNELSYVLKQSGMTTLVHAPRFRQADYVAMVEEAGLQAPALKTRIVLDDLTPSPSPSQGEGRKLGVTQQAGARDLTPNPSPSQGEGSTESIQELIPMSGTENPPLEKGRVGRGLSLSWNDLHELASKSSRDQLRSRESLLQFDDPINIQYTS